MSEKYRSCKGFTLVELMAVLLIIALLAGVAAKNIMGQIEKAKVNTTKATLANLHQAVNMFKIDTGRYPNEDIGLWELVEEPTDVTGWAEGGYLEQTKVPLDGWKNEFLYLLNPESGKPFVIISFGADGKEGGDGKNADIESTNLDGISDSDNLSGSGGFDDTVEMP